MPKRALVVGINNYENVSALNSCVADAESIAEVLSRNADNSINFECMTLLSPGSERITRAYLRRRWEELFHDFRGDIVFYFSGHGAPTDSGGYLVTQEGTLAAPGLPMDDVVTLANESVASTVLIILDCCFSGAAGNVVGLQPNKSSARVLLREGVTILAASRPAQVSMETDSHGVFTELLVGGLRGGAADLRGRVSAASLYGYAESALGAWDQRPLYKSHAARLEPIRCCIPRVTDDEIRAIPLYFPARDFEYKLDPTYEETSPAAIPEHVAIFKAFKRLQLAGLVRPKTGDDLYWAAERSFHAELTELGKFYLVLVSKGRI
jgi:hypothetical protein